jgi:hypothetical protein
MFYELYLKKQTSYKCIQHPRQYATTGVRIKKLFYKKVNAELLNIEPHEIMMKMSCISDFLKK